MATERFNTSLLAAILGLVSGLEVGAHEGTSDNRLSIEGLSLKPQGMNRLALQIRKIEATGLRLASGALTLDIDQLSIQDLSGVWQPGSGDRSIQALHAGEMHLTGLRLAGPLPSPSEVGADTPARAVADAWRLDPLGEASGTVRGHIIDAQLLFDADTTIPIQHGLIDFNDVAVEHVGPDSRMGISRMGLYVDAPNGRSYLYRFASAPITGVEFEQRGALLVPWVSERGKLQLQPFAESMLRQGHGDRSAGLTDQAKLLLGRTALSGELRLGDGLVAMPGLQATLLRGDEQDNALQIESKSMAQRLSVRMASMSAAEAVAVGSGARLHVETATANAELELLLDGPALRFELALQAVTLTGLRLDLS